LSGDSNRCSSCGEIGHNRRRCVDLACLVIGTRFGEWTLQSLPENGRDLFWDVRCDCGTEAFVNRKNLMIGVSASCGKCLHTGDQYLPIKKPQFIHGMTGTPTWNSWNSMLRRAGKHPRYLTIGVYEPWRAEFLKFLKDMGERPEGTSIDRYPDEFGDYLPWNCRWATPVEQQNNRRPNGFWRQS